MSRVHVIAIITAKPGKRAEVLENFNANVAAVHAEVEQHQPKNPYCDVCNHCLLQRTPHRRQQIPHQERYTEWLECITADYIGDVKSSNNGPSTFTQRKRDLRSPTGAGK